MDKAVYGLLGVGLGFLLTVLKDWLIQRTKNKKNVEYLCVHVTCMLDRFVKGCSDVVGDNGLYHGQPDEDGYSKIQVSTPFFNPEKLEVEWKSLPTKMMYRILNFPLNIENVNASIDSTFEHVATPPDYSEGFEERQYQYVILGIKANRLATNLRILGKLPSKEIGDWDSMQFMEDEKIKIEKLRETRYKNSETMFKNIPELIDSN